MNAPIEPPLLCPWTLSRERCAEVYVPTRRYQMYAQRQKWKVALVSESAAERGGLKECILQVVPHS